MYHLPLSGIDLPHQLDLVHVAHFRLPLKSPQQSHLRLPHHHRHHYHYLMIHLLLLRIRRFPLQILHLWVVLNRFHQRRLSEVQVMLVQAQGLKVTLQHPIPQCRCC